MNRRDFMDALERQLYDVPLEERIDALQYYEDYFEDAGFEKEQDIINELKSPEDVANIIKKDLGINTTTLNMWCKGNSIPGTGKTRALADYFNIGMSDLTDIQDFKNSDDKYSDVVMKIGLYDERFKRIILEYNKMSASRKRILCDFFDEFIF